MNDLSATPKIGDNKGPAFNDEIATGFMTRARDFADAAGDWKETGKIETEEQAQKANDFLAGARKLYKEVDERRKLEKQPYLDAGREVDAAFNKIKDLIERASKMVKPLAEKFLIEKEAREREERNAAERKAREEAERAAAEQRAAEERNDVAGQQEAEEKAKAAEKIAADAAKFKGAQVSSATGGGSTQSLRTTKTAVITNINSAMLYYRDTREMAELVLRLANAEARHAKGAEITIPGIEITETRKL